MWRLRLIVTSRKLFSAFFHFVAKSHSTCFSYAQTSKEKSFCTNIKHPSTLAFYPSWSFLQVASSHILHSRKSQKCSHIFPSSPTSLRIESHNKNTHKFQGKIKIQNPAPLNLQDMSLQSHQGDMRGNSKSSFSTFLLFQTCQHILTAAERRAQGKFLNDIERIFMFVVYKCRKLCICLRRPISELSAMKVDILSIEASKLRLREETRGTFLRQQLRGRFNRSHKKLLSARQSYALLF